MAAVYIATTPVHAIYVGGSQVTQVIGAGSGDLTYVVLPSITGSAIETLVVTADEGTVTGVPTITYAYQWFRDGAVIEGPPEFLEDPELELV